MLEILRLDTCDGFPIVHDLGPRLDKSVKDDVAKKVHYGNTRQSVPLLSENALAVDG
jgi:hypothetical protein